MLDVTTGQVKWLRRQGRRLAVWWTGNDVDQAWAALHTAGHALLAVEPDEVIKARLGDIAATVVTSLSADDIRVKDYLKTLELLAPATVTTTAADRAQLRVMSETCDDAADAGHADARVFRNTLVLLGVFLSDVVVVIAAVAWGDRGFRSAFAGADARPGRWYVLELEMIASLAGLTGAVLSLKSYKGFQFTYGLPFVQALLKGSAGAATGLFGVLLVQSGIVTSLKPQAGVGVFAIAIVFGYAQYLFTRLVDKQANDVLNAAGSRNDPGITPKVSPGATSPTLLTTRNSAGALGAQQSAPTDPADHVLQQLPADHRGNDSRDGSGEQDRPGSGNVGGAGELGPAPVSQQIITPGSCSVAAPRHGCCRIRLATSP